MLKFLFIPFIIIVTFLDDNNSLKAQVNEQDTTVFITPEFPPKLINNSGQSINDFINENLKYPYKRQCIEGKVFLSFLVDTLGMVDSVKVLKGLTVEANQSAINVVKKMKLSPATQFGVKVRARLIVVVPFNI